MIFKKQFVLISILFFSASLLINAQDTSDTDESWHWEWDDVKEWTGWWKKKPSVSLNYGFSNLSRKDVVAPFADNNLIELKLGYTTRRGSRYAKFLNRHRFRYLFITHNSSKLAGGSNTTSDIESSNWRFGFARSSGYGYSIGKTAAIVPYFTWSLDWTKMDFTYDSLTTNDKRVVDLYDGSFRFGSSNEAGLRIQATRLITFEAGFERSIVFERHLFWKWTGSAIIELAAHGLLDVFLNEILESSPEAGPVLFLILKSALGYGLYELRKDKMNWPFSSAPPLVFDNIKLGFTFVF
jgi:hypothetical protein